MKTNLLFLSAIVLILASCSKPPKNFKPGEIWPDNNGVHINAHGGGLLFHDGKYYWFGEHKIEGDAGNRAWVGVHCYSSVNLTDWKDEGIALEVVKNDTLSEITEGCVIERPKVIYNGQTKKFVMWFHLELKGKGYDAARTGVAVGDNATGPFKFVKSFRPNAGYWPQNVKEIHKQPVADTILSKYCGGKGCLPAHPDTVNLLGRDFTGGQMARDQNLFVDDDGKAYHIYSSEENSTLHISQLTDDYLADAGNYIRVFSDRYMEAPAMFKHDGKYFLMASDCTGWSPNAARLAWAPTIFGPWEELVNPCRGNDAETTFHSQSTTILPVQGKKDAFIYMGDRWKPENAIDGRYIWLPVQFDENGIPYLEWMDEWNLGFLDKKKGNEIAMLTQSVLLANVGQAMQKGGPVYAVEFCNLKASAITDSLNAVNNCIISRISAKNRNPGNNLKTEADKKLWAIFEAGAANDTIIQENKKLVYYKPIRTALPACLKCHGIPGSDIDSATIAKLNNLYPADLATGYKLNDFRGLWRIEFTVD